MVDVNVIPMNEFELGWRLTDPKYRVLPQIHLDQIEPLDGASARRLHEIAETWYLKQPFIRGHFEELASVSINCRDREDCRRIRKWLYQQGIPFKHRVFLSWDARVAAVTTWKMVVKYWEDLWYPSSDDLWVFDESLSWVLFLWHEEEAFFARHPRHS